LNTEDDLRMNRGNTKG